LKNNWVPPDIRDDIITTFDRLKFKTKVPINTLLKAAGLSWARYHDWQKRFGQPNKHNSDTPRDFWLEPWEKQAIIDYKENHMTTGYKRLTYMMLDDDIAAVSPSTTYRILRQAGLTTRWNNKALEAKRKGFVQPERPHQHWHMDISYVNFHGSHLFLISVLDGYSRFIVHHELRTHMQEYDVEIVLERALEKYPGQTPRIISDNGTQFIANDFKAFLRLNNLTHVRTSVNHPQANGKQEAFHKTIKNECIRVNSFLDLDDARNMVADYVHEYNHKRLHSGIKFIAPYDMLCGRAESIFKERDLKLERARQRRKQNAQLKQKQNRGFSSESLLTKAGRVRMKNLELTYFN
jgi:transposase InsO family protein